jgi:hypothetical protein
VGSLQTANPPLGQKYAEASFFNEFYYNLPHLHPHFISFINYNLPYLRPHFNYLLY